jgi:hypothetical protein
VLSAVGYEITTQTYYYDVRYVVQSVAVIAYVVWATWLYGRRSNAPVAAPVPAP